MKKLRQYIGWTLLLIILAVNCYGSDVTRVINIEYLPDSTGTNWLKDALKQSSTTYQPTIALSYFSNENDTGDLVGAIFNRSGKKVETLVSFIKPVDIIQIGITQYLEKTGFKVIPTSSWNLTAETIPSYLKVDFIMGGRLKAFWVESRSKFFSSTIDSKVIFDLYIADAKNQEILWNEEISGHIIKKTLAHTNQYFWTDLYNSMNSSLSQAVNQVFQADARKVVISLLHIYMD